MRGALTLTRGLSFDAYGAPVRTAWRAYLRHVILIDKKLTQSRVLPEEGRVTEPIYDWSNSQRKCFLIGHSDRADLFLNNRQVLMLIMLIHLCFT